MNLLRMIFMCGFVLAGSTLSQAGAEKPARAILFIIDGLHWQAPEKLSLQHFRSLAAEGTSFEKAYLLMPYHPTTGRWGELYTCSIPNPVMLAGTLFIRPDQPLVQHSFYPQALTAHVTNSMSYRSLNSGNSFSMIRTTGDAEAVSFALELLQKEDVRFLRIHLQDTGSAGSECADATRDVPWRRNIWGEGSPYVAAAQEADRLLGAFVEGLKKMGKWEDTLLVVTADHGQISTGWHPLLPEDSWITPLLFTGPGVAQGSRFPYAEHIDIIPTICDFMGVTAPESHGGGGSPLAELRGGSSSRPQGEALKNLNRQLKEYLLLNARMLIAAEEHPYLENRILMAERQFYGLHRFLEWHQAGSLSRLMEVNEAVLKELKKALQEFSR